MKGTKLLRCAAAGVLTLVLTACHAVSMTRDIVGDTPGITLDSIAETSIVMGPKSASGMNTCRIGNETFYYIETEEQLRSIGKNAQTRSLSYMLSNSITLTGEWVPIGSKESPFTGRFEGNGNEIINLKVTSPGLECYGMFAYTGEGSVVHNVALRDPVFENTQGGTIGPVVCIGLGSCSDSQIIRTGAGNGETVSFAIETEEQLRSIGCSEYALSRNYEMLHDITLTREWVPIGSKESPFTGRFEGNGNEIVNLKVTSANAAYYGLFGYTGEGVSVHDVVLRDPVLAKTQEGAAVPFVCAGKGKSENNQIVRTT